MFEYDPVEILEPLAPRKERPADATGFVPGQDRTKSAPELLEEVKRLSAENDLLKRRDALLDKEISQLKSRANLLEEANRNLDALSGQLQERLVALKRDNEILLSGKATKDTSDGYHTFADLYTHRRALTAALTSMVVRLRFLLRHPAAWRSRLHHPEDGPMFDGSFIVGIDLPNGTISYHYNNRYWDDFSHVPELEHAPKWDGAGPELTITRLLDFARG